MTGRGTRVIGIRWIVILVAVGLTTAVVLSVGTVAERNARRALTSELTSRLLLEARNLALTSSGVLLNDFPELTLHPLLKEKLASQPELAYAVVVDRAGVIQGHADPHRLGTRFDEPVGLLPLLDGPPCAPGETLRRNDRELVATVPILHASGKRLGHVVVAMRVSYVDAVIRSARRQQTLILGLSLLVGIAVSFLVLSHLLRPVAALRSGIQRIASGDLETPVRVNDGTELGLLATAINDMAAELRKAQTEMVERERLAREMELAREIQGSILPSKGIVAGPFTIEGSQRAATEVGGDYYDYFQLPGGTVGIAVADVSGKGLAGCLIMSMLYALLRADRAGATSPAALLAALDERLSDTLRPGSFVTMFYGILDPSTGRLVFASAGHNPTLIYRRATGAVEILRSRGIPLGAIRGGAIRGTLEDQAVVLEPGDELLQFTDGISEAFDSTGREQFGHDRMADVFRETAAAGPRAVIDGFFERIQAWSGSGPRLDDETIVVLARDAAHVAAPAPDTVGAGPSGSQARPGLPSGIPADPAKLYREARRRGVRLDVRVGSDLLDSLRGWTSTVVGLDGVAASERELLVTTLYEICANIAEHGYGENPGRSYELWWVPPARRRSASADLREGWFLIRDEGAPFQANDWNGQDFNDARVRRRGRGLGLEIIHRAMRGVVYFPSTADGNLTWMCFGGMQTPKEASHAG